MHAVMARRRGLAVTHLEREQEGRGASVRNFGLVWVSGRRAGPELALALRARELWESIAADAPGTGFRPAGSLTIATTESELAVMREAAELPDAKQREFEVLSADDVRAVNPALRGEFLGGLWCRADAIVEPRVALPALRAWLMSAGGAGYEWLPGREAVELAANGVRDQLGLVGGDGQRPGGPESRARSVGRDRLPQLAGAQRECELGAGPSPAHPDEPEVPDARAAPFLFPLQVRDRKPAPPRHDRVHRAEDPAADNDNPPRLIHHAN